MGPKDLGTPAHLILSPRPTPMRKKCPILCFFHPQNKSSPHQNPTFGLTLYKFIVMGPVRKPQPYNWRRLWESCSCDDECNSLLRRGQIPQGRLWWPVYCAIRGELPDGSQLSGPLALCAWPSPPLGVRPPRISRPTPLRPD